MVYALRQLRDSVLIIAFPAYIVDHLFDHFEETPPLRDGVCKFFQPLEFDRDSPGFHRDALAECGVLQELTHVGSPFQHGLQIHVAGLIPGCRRRQECQCGLRTVFAALSAMLEKLAPAVIVFQYRLQTEGGLMHDVTAVGHLWKLFAKQGDSAKEVAAIRRNGSR